MSLSSHSALDEWGSQWVIPSSLTFPMVVQLQEPAPCQPAQTTARLRYGGAGSICWCTSGTQMHSFKEKQTQTEMTDCQLPGAYRTSHIPTQQGVFIAACHLLESIHLAVRQPRCPHLVYRFATIRLIQESERNNCVEHDRTARRKTVWGQCPTQHTSLNVK